jgi:hypothetical protein
MKLVARDDVFSKSPITDGDIEIAIEKGKNRNSIRVAELRYFPPMKSIILGLSDGAAVLLPVKNYKELSKLTAVDLKSMYLGFAGSALCIDSKDLHISIAGMVAASDAFMDLASSVISSRNGSIKSVDKARTRRPSGEF